MVTVRCTSALHGSRRRYLAGTRLFLSRPIPLVGSICPLGGTIGADRCAIKGQYKKETLNMAPVKPHDSGLRDALNPVCSAAATHSTLGNRSCHPGLQQQEGVGKPQERRFRRGDASSSTLRMQRARR